MRVLFNISKYVDPVHDKKFVELARDLIEKGYTIVAHRISSAALLFYLEGIPFEELRDCSNIGMCVRTLKKCKKLSLES